MRSRWIARLRAIMVIWKEDVSAFETQFWRPGRLRIQCGAVRGGTQGAGRRAQGGVGVGKLVRPVLDLFDTAQMKKMSCVLVWAKDGCRESTLFWGGQPWRL